MTRQTSGTRPERERARNCAECGTPAEPGQPFCDACGAVLGWTAPPRAPEQPREEGGPAARDPHDGVAVPPQGGPVDPDDEPTEPLPPAVPAPDPAIHPSAAAYPPAGAATDVPPAHVVPAGAHPADAAAVDVAAANAPAAAAAMDAAATDAAALEAAERARQLLIPVADTEQAPPVPSVAPVLPGRPLTDRPQVRAPGPEHGAEGGIPCPWCHTPNRPDRHFCGRCAMPMAGSPAAPELRLSWWRRLLDRRNRPAPWAGQRPRLNRGFGRLLNWVVGAVVLALLITAGLNTGTAVQAVRDHFAKRAPVRPDQFGASRSYAGHGPQLAFDETSNTWWAPGVSQSGTGEWLEARFDQPTRLLDLIITPGESTQAAQLSQSALPHRIDAVITTADGKTTTRPIVLDEGAGPQQRAFHADNVTAVRFVLQSAYGAAPDKQVAIAEVEFFGPSNGNGA
ncbi:zinc ribbon domain-containing protein [Streptomyces sp. PTM05]|uniref:Zinc ribbon domain-containing protein n=1 Tax=Streptantibioticus parmotrematis TaxID=2873249 RepID=A0ABS7R069_9ACTN|nr:zinc ribbon domain-containing protein [Streptantibioticus parmotrematis]MBY8888864.1 zinc ribbon domain-containing protein [Streptantibioticus parmotrematis]